jgi:hypothetical protein
VEIILKKVSGGLLPANAAEAEKLHSFKAGAGVRCKVTRVRNYQFLKKYFALLNLAYDYWEPEENLVGEKNFERFRSDVIILAGFYEAYVRVDGSTRIEPKSISFGSMSEDEFSDLYTKTIDALVKHVLPRFTGDELRDLVRAIEDFETQ